MQKVNFTADRVASFRGEPGKQQTLIWDGKTPGLGLRVTASGAKSYIFESRLFGRTLRVTLGDERTLTVAKAQAEATRLKALTDQGIDPRQQKADLRASAEERRAVAARHDVTVAEAWAVYVESRRSRWSAHHLADHQKLMQSERCKKVGGEERVLVAGVLDSLSLLKLTELDSACVAKWLNRETAHRPTQAALGFRLLRAFLNWCSDHPDYSSAHTDACTRKVSREHLPKKQAKTDCLQREQLKAWFDNVQKIGNPVIRAYLQVLLITGARREELAGLTWEHADFQWGSLTIRDKVDGERIIPLTPYVASLLAGLPRRNQWVFSSAASASGRLREPSIAHRRAVVSAGLPLLTLHGLRRSFGTLAEWVECPAGVSAQIMGHKPSATAEKHYRQRPVDLLRMWHTKIEAWVLNEAGIVFVPAEQSGALRVVK